MWLARQFSVADILNHKARGVYDWFSVFRGGRIFPKFKCRIRITVIEHFMPDLCDRLHV